MLAVFRESVMPKLPSLDSIKHLIYMIAPNFFRTDGIGANKHFVEQAAYVKHLFTRVDAVTRSGHTRAVFRCKKCAASGSYGVATTLGCSRVILDRSVVGKVIGRMRWRMPACETCDHELPRDVTDPILVDHGRKCEGYVDIPDELLLFFDATIEDA